MAAAVAVVDAVIDASVALHDSNVVRDDNFAAPAPAMAAVAKLVEYHHRHKNHHPLLPSCP